jgi:hypothetical protein
MPKLYERRLAGPSPMQTPMTRSITRLKVPPTTKQANGSNLTATTSQVSTKPQSAI